MFNLFIRCLLFSAAVSWCQGFFSWQGKNIGGNRFLEISVREYRSGFFKKKLFKIYQKSLNSTKI
jgi:hypothetical protein